MDLGLTAKRALVLAASSGLGKGSASVLVEEGSRVAICSSNPEKLQQTKHEISAELSICADLTKPNEARRVVEETIAKLGGIDLLVTNCGGPKKGHFEEISKEDWSLGFDSIFLSVTESIRAALPSMRANKFGRIVLITSSAAREGIDHLTISNSIRAGLLGLVKSFSREVARDGITINAVLPGFTKTERLKAFGSDLDSLAKDIPVGRLGCPLELGALVAYLCSKQAGFITGSAFPYDGGALRSI